MEQSFTAANGEVITLSYNSTVDSVSIKCASLGDQFLELATNGSLEDGTINHIMVIESHDGGKWQELFDNSGIELDLRNFYETNKVNK